MGNKISTNLRKWLSLFAAVLIYYLFHEGAHFVFAAACGVFEAVKFMGVGVQIVITEGVLNNFQLGIFCIVGSLAALFAGYIFTALTGKIAAAKSKYIKAIGFYSTLVLLLLDPLYLTVFYRFFGGGDMNGILLLGVPEILANAVYGVIGVINLIIFIKYVYPKYKVAFA